MQIYASAFSINQQPRPSTLALRNSNFEPRLIEVIEVTKITQ